MSTDLAEIIEAPATLRKHTRPGMRWEKFDMLARECVRLDHDARVIARTDWDDEIDAWLYRWDGSSVACEPHDTGRRYGVTFDGGSAVWKKRLRLNEARDAATRYVLSVIVRGDVMTTGPKVAVLTLNGDVIERLNDAGEWQKEGDE